MRFSLYPKFKSPEIFFFVSMLLFGIVSTFITFPLTNGDEGYHLGTSYAFFSKSKPNSMTTDTVRNIELSAISPNKTAQEFDTHSFFKTKLSDVEQDSISFNLQKDNNLTLKVDIGHIPAAIGVLIGRLIYPSYGVMLIFSRLTNLFFFLTCLFFIIRSSKLGKWALVMLFSVPFIQKIASPSYDVYSYIAMSAFVVNIFNISKVRHFKQLTKKQIIYSLFTILLILLAKNNYVFILLSLLFLPMFTKPIITLYSSRKKGIKILFWLVLSLIFIVIASYLNSKFGLVNFIHQFINSYFNVATMGRRGKTLFNVVSTILPDIFNILWLLSLFFVMVCEQKYDWETSFISGEILIFLINWIGIFAGFYLIYGKPTYVIDDLSGRYLHPFLICFLPFTQKLSYKYTLTTSKKAIGTVAMISTTVILISYLFVCYYRGYVLHTTPTWTV